MYQLGFKALCFGLCRLYIVYKHLYKRINVRMKNEMRLVQMYKLYQSCINEI